MNFQPAMKVVICIPLLAKVSRRSKDQIIATPLSHQHTIIAVNRLLSKKLGNPRQELYSLRNQPGEVVQEVLNPSVHEDAHQVESQDVEI